MPKDAITTLVETVLSEVRALRSDLVKAGALQPKRSFVPPTIVSFAPVEPLPSIDVTPRAQRKRSV